MAFTAVLEADLRALSSEARRRYPVVKDAAEHAILKLRSTSDPGQLAKSDDIVRTFLLACEPKNVKMSSLGLACMQKLISHDAVSPTALSSILSTLKEHSEMSEEVIQLKTLQTILTILQSQLHPNDEESMAILLEICLTLLANNRSADSVHGTAAATLRQAVALIFDRVISSEKLPILNSGWRSRTARSNSVSGDVSRNMVAAKAVEKALTDDPHVVRSKEDLTQAGKLGLRLFEDLTSLAGGGSATWLHVSSLQKNFALDMLEYVLSHYVPIFRKLAPYEQVLRDQVCSLLMTSMRTSSELDSGGDSDPAYRRLVLRTMASVTRLYSSIVTTECEVFLSMLVKSADLDLPLWHRIMVLEVLRGFCVEARMLRLLFQTFDMQPKNANLVTDLVKALAKVVSTLQVQEVSEESIALNTAVAGMFNSKAKGVEWAMEHDATAAAVVVASEAHTITLAVEGLLGVVFTVATLTDEAMEAGELNSPRFETPGNNRGPPIPQSSHKDGGELASTCLVLVSAVWSTLLDALSLMLSRSQGEAIVLEILKGYQAFTQSCGVLRAIPPRDAFLASLCKYSLAPMGDTEKLNGSSSNGLNGSSSQGGKRASDPGLDQREGVVLTTKNLQALRTLFNISHRLNCVLDQSWVMVLETLAVVDRLIHSPHATTQEVSAFGARTSEGRQASEFQVLLLLDSQLFESSAMMTTSAVLSLLTALREVSLNSLTGVTSGLGAAASGSSVAVASNVGVAMLPKMFAVDRMLATLSNNLHRADLLWGQVSAHFLELTEHESPQVRAVALDALDRSISAVLGCERIRRDTVTFKATTGEELKVVENTEEFGQFVTLRPSSETFKSSRRPSVLKVRKGSFQLDAFECAVLLPLSSIYHRGQTAELRFGAVKILLHVLERHGEKLYHSWPSILELLRSVANDSEKDIVTLGFQNVRIIMNDGLLSIPSHALDTCVHVAGAYGAQKTDMNISLTAIGLLWTVADFFARGVDHKVMEGDASRQLVGMRMEVYSPTIDPGRIDNSTVDTASELNSSTVLVERTDMDWDGLLLAVYGVLQSLGTDERPEVRNSAIRTLFQSVSSHGLKMSSAMWEHCLWKLIFPLVNTVRHLAATSSKDEIGKELGMQGGKTVHMLVHHSRNTAQKQWDETLVVVLGGFSRLFKPPYFHICQSINNFKQGWEVILSFIQESVVEGSKEVGLAASSSLHSILLMQASKSSLSSFFFDSAFSVYEAIVLSIATPGNRVNHKVSQELLQSVAELYVQGFTMFEPATYLRMLAMVDVYVRHPSNVGETPAGGVLPPLQRTGLDVLPSLKPMDEKLTPLWPVVLRQMLSYLPGGEGLIGDHCKNLMAAMQRGPGEEDSFSPQNLVNGHDLHQSSPSPRKSFSEEPHSPQSDQSGGKEADAVVPEAALDSSALSLALSVKVLVVLLQLYEAAPSIARAVVLPTLVGALGRCMATRRDSPTDLLWRQAVGNFNRVVEESLIPDSGRREHSSENTNREVNRPKFWKEVAEAYEKFLVGACGRAFTLPGGEPVSADVIKADEFLEASIVDVLSHKVLNSCQDAPREVTYRLIDVIDRCAARTSLLPLPSVALLPVHCGRFSLLCLNRLFKLCWVAPEATAVASKIAVSRISVTILTRRCSSILRQFQVDENDSGETPMPQVRVDELIFVLEELARLVLHPLTASALELPITRKEIFASTKGRDPKVWQYGHLLLLFSPLCELVGSRVTRVNELLHILLRMMGRELGL